MGLVKYIIEKNLIFGFLKFIALLGILILAVSLGFILLLDTPSDSRTCVPGPNVRIQVSGVEFSLPLDYQPLVSTLDGRVLTPRTCRDTTNEPSPEPLDGVGWHLRTWTSRVVHDSLSMPINGTAVNLTKSGNPNPISKTYYRRFLEDLSKADVDLESLPRVGEFFLYAPNVEHYIAAPDGPKTPDGIPVYIQCTPAGSTTTPKNSGPGELCWVTYAWSDSLTLNYSFRNGRYPISEWRDLDSAMRKLIETSIKP